MLPTLVLNTCPERIKSPTVHCLVHPGFDADERTEFEEYLHSYIQYVASTTNDILLIVSDGESFDNEQMCQFVRMRMIEGISLYLSLHDGGMWDLIKQLNPNYQNSIVLKEYGLSRELYVWCQENVDMSEVMEVADAWRSLKEDYFSGKYGDNLVAHDAEAARLRAWEEEVRVKLDIKSLSQKALDDLGVLAGEQRFTKRNIKNRARFTRLYQHAMQALGMERMREIFIADAERDDSVAIQPVSHFRTADGMLQPTPIVPPLSNFKAQILNESESFQYGNAGKLMDEIVYDLSLSRYRKLANNQALDAFKAMGFQITPETEFIFFWEYRHRCIENVKEVMYSRLRGIAGEWFFTAHDAFTLLRADDEKQKNI